MTDQPQSGIARAQRRGGARRYKWYPYGTAAGLRGIVGIDQRDSCDSYALAFHRYFDGDRGGYERVTDTVYIWASGYQMAVDTFWYVR